MSIGERVKQGVREFIGLEPRSKWFDITYAGEPTPENLRVIMSDEFLNMGKGRMRLIWPLFEQTQHQLQNSTQLIADHLDLIRMNSRRWARAIQTICGINGIVIWQKLVAMRNNSGQYDHGRLVGTD